MAKVLCFSGVCCLLALLLGQPSLGQHQPWPFSESNSPADTNDLFGFWKKMREKEIIDEFIARYYQALGFLSKKDNCTYLPALKETVNVQVMNMHGKMYVFNTILVKVTCSPGEERPNHKNCQIVPGSPKYLCKLELVSFPTFKILNVKVISCEEYRVTQSSPVIPPGEEPKKEEGTPYM